MLLTVIQPPFGLAYFAWLAYVPLILVSIKKSKGIFLCSYIIALVYWLGNIYWMGFITIAGWIAFCAYTALLWPLLIASIRYLYEKKVPLLIAAPAMIVGIEHLQGFLLGGFYWRHLSHSQYANLSLIQISDIFGAAGVSFLIAMVNGLISQLILTVRNSEKKSYLFSIYCSILNSKFSILIVAVLIISTILYGKWRIRKSEQTITQGPVVGVVQSNVPQSVKDSDESEITREVFASLLELSEKCRQSEAELIIWPETIVPAIMNKQVWPFLYDANDNLFFHKSLSEHSSQGIYVLIGSPGGKIRFKNQFEPYLEKYNTATLYTPAGDQASTKYNKIHLVPFGEAIPFKYSFPPLYNFLMMFSPYDFDYNLTPGSEFTVFEIQDSNDSQQKYRFGVIICYEGVVPHIARKFALDNNKTKQIDWLVNISNDGWFVRFKDKQIKASTELAQHTISCVFRAIENRLSVVRSVNTGISCIIDPIGHIKDGYLEGNLPYKAMDRQAVGGWFVHKVPIDSRITIFSRFGNWLGRLCKIIVMGVLILLIIERFVRKNMYGRPKNVKNSK
ncbi:MAG: apolipoprotein N-acyltransferase [Phycisphaerae bacterium]